MKLSIILTLLCSSLYAADTNRTSLITTNSPLAPRTLVQVVFAADDMAPTQQFHTIISLGISSNSRGVQQYIYNWAVHGGGGPDTNAMTEAAACLKLFQSLDQPKELPESQNRIVSVRCRDGDVMLEKTFLIGQVPDEVHQILATKGFSDYQFARLKFVQKPGQPHFTNWNPSIPLDGR